MTEKLETWFTSSLCARILPLSTYYVHVVGTYVATRCVQLDHTSSTVYSIVAVQPRALLYIRLTASTRG